MWSGIRNARGLRIWRSHLCLDVPVRFESQLYTPRAVTMVGHYVPGTADPKPDDGSFTYQKEVYLVLAALALRVGHEGTRCMTRGSYVYVFTHYCENV